MVEYSPPNTNKPLHLAHVRNNLLGHALSEVLKVNGKRLVKTNLVNDRGIHICKSMLAWNSGVTARRRYRPARRATTWWAITTCCLTRNIRRSSRLCEAKGFRRRRLKPRPLMEQTREMLRSGREAIGRRSPLEEDERLVTRGLMRPTGSWAFLSTRFTTSRIPTSPARRRCSGDCRRDFSTRRRICSVWADLSSDGLDHKLLLRSDGTSVYMTQDIGTAKLRFDDYPIDTMIYVVGTSRTTISRYSPFCWIGSVSSLVRGWSTSLTGWWSFPTEDEVARRHRGGRGRPDGGDD